MQSAPALCFRWRRRVWLAGWSVSDGPWIGLDGQTALFDTTRAALISLRAAAGRLASCWDEVIVPMLGSSGPAISVEVGTFGFDRAALRERARDQAAEAVATIEAAARTETWRILDEPDTAIALAAR